MYSTTAIFTAVILLVSFDNGLCLNCYQCTSTNNPSCKDPFENPKAVLNVNCNSNEVSNFYNSYLNAIMPAPTTQNAPRYCLKITLASSSGSGDTIIRTCAEGPSNNMNKTCTELERGPGFSQYVSSGVRQNLKYCNVCDGDSCNSANTHTVSVLLGLIAVSALAYITH